MLLLLLRDVVVVAVVVRYRVVCAVLLLCAVRSFVRSFVLFVCVAIGSYAL